MDQVNNDMLKGCLIGAGVIAALIAVIVLIAKVVR